MSAVIVKIGGAAITDKAQHERLRVPELEATARWLGDLHRA
jgi:isopentenyl phosphate kinase